MRMSELELEEVQTSEEEAWVAVSLFPVFRRLPGLISVPSTRLTREGNAT